MPEFSDCLRSAGPILDETQSGLVLLMGRDDEFLSLMFIFPISWDKFSLGAHEIFASHMRVAGRVMPLRTKIHICCFDVGHLGSGATGAAFASRNRYGAATIEISVAC